MPIRHLAHIPSRIKNWYANPFRHKSNVAETLTVLLTLVLAIIGFLQWRVYRQQKAIMESSGQQTQKLIDAANIQACAATRNAQSASISANAASDLAAQTKNIAERTVAKINATNTLASQAARSANAAETANTNALETDRPWIGASFVVQDFTVDKTPTYAVVFLNTGKRPAKVALTQTLSALQDYGENPVYRPYETSPSSSVLVPGQVDIASWSGDQDLRTNPISDALMKAVNSNAPLLIYAKIEYLRSED